MIHEYTSQCTRGKIRKHNKLVEASFHNQPPICADTHVYENNSLIRHGFRNFIQNNLVSRIVTMFATEEATV